MVISTSTNSLKRYNSKVTIRLNRQEKEILKKKAYKKNINMSEYLRSLIIIDNRLSSFYSNIEKSNKNLEDIFKHEYFIGRYH